MITILHEDNHLLVVNKTAGLPTMGAAAGERSLIHDAKEYLRKKYAKPGNVYLGVVSRLDSPVSGVLAFARTSKAAARLTRQFQDRTVEKSYWAIVPNGLQPRHGECQDWIRHRESERRMVVCKESSPGAAHASLTYSTIAEPERCQLLEIQLETGRKHQIRIQLASRGHPILGDSKYGSTRKFALGIALHSRTLQLTHPVTKERLMFTAPPPPTWSRYLNS